MDWDVTFNEDGDPIYPREAHAYWATAALVRHQNEAEESDDWPRGVSFLIRDLMHLADDKGWDFGALIRLGAYLHAVDTGMAVQKGDGPAVRDLWRQAANQR